MAEQKDSEKTDTIVALFVGYFIIGPLLMTALALLYFWITGAE